MLDLIVIEDNLDLNDLLVENLSDEGYRVHGFTDAQSYESSGIAGEVFLLDLNLPTEDGLTFAARLKAGRPEVAIVVLSARSGADARTRTYLSGADTFLRKPCDLAEVIAAVASAAQRVRYLSDRRAGRDRLTLSLGSLRLSGRQGSANLTEEEARLLAALLAAPGQRMTYDDVLRLVDPSGDLRRTALEVRLARLQKKIRPVTGDKLIRSIRNWGYRLVQDVALDD